MHNYISVKFALRKSYILNPQGSDIERGLLEFATGKELDTAGKYWLGIHLANTYGMSKLTFEERLIWCETHASLIHDLACLRYAKAGATNGDPQPSPQALEFWRKADKPWGGMSNRV